LFTGCRHRRTGTAQNHLSELEENSTGRLERAVRQVFENPLVFSFSYHSIYTTLGSFSAYTNLFLLWSPAYLSKERHALPCRHVTYHILPTYVHLPRDLKRKAQWKGPKCCPTSTTFQLNLSAQVTLNSFFLRQFYIQFQSLILPDGSHVPNSRGDY